MYKTIKIGKQKIGKNQPCFVVAEISANHNGKLKNAIKLIKAAKKAGANAVKIQTYTAETITINTNKKDFLISQKSPWVKYRNLYNLYNAAHTPWRWHKKLKSTANSIGLELFSSPFDLTAVNYLSKLKMPAYKVASPEINDINLLKSINKTKQPIILSSGLADFKRLYSSISFLKKRGCKKLVLLKCITSYPSSKSESNLKTLIDMRRTFDCIVGLSDHSLGYDVSCTAVALGAKIIEKHFKLNNMLKTPDSFFSLDPKNFSKMVKKIRNIEMLMGKIDYSVSKSAKANMHSMRSIYVSKNIKKGNKFTLKNTKSVRPGFGLDPKDYNKILGKKSSKNLYMGDRINLRNVY